ncbi:MAG TPA: LL-diaminopimelate aminotransferase [Spirochaetia bacterium]|nr:LL-diaminopimelate aminotransferase [Spirochaetia bacterium]
MIRVNESYLKLQSSYLFSEIAGRVARFQDAHPDREIIKLGIGDVTRALSPVCVAAFRKAVEEMGEDASFRGYGPEQGYSFLREKIAEHDFNSVGADISADEIFISDGAKCDTANIQELFADDIRIAVPDPVYPVYVDSSVMAGRTGRWNQGRYEGLTYLESTESNGFVPDLPNHDVDLIFLCFPNNPTGATISREKLEAWVEYAIENRALILYDAAYVAFIRDKALPGSVFEIPGAREVAVEFRSYSKTAGFTGTRCAYTVVPKSCMAYDRSGKGHPLHSLWNRRQTTKFNGVSYPVQRAAEAVYSPEGRKQTRELIDYYLNNAAIIKREMTALGYSCVGGDNSPYIWVDGKRDSWEFFDLMLERAGVVCTPGSGFGRCGEGYIRISSFNSLENVESALQKISSALA